MEAGQDDQHSQMYIAKLRIYQVMLDICVGASQEGVNG